MFAWGSTMSAPTTSARDLFRELLSPEFLNGLRPPSPTAVYTPYIVVWLFIAMNFSSFS